MAAFGQRLALCCVLLALVTPLHAEEPNPAGKFDLRPGDHISIIGNTLADRMQHDGWLEMLLHSRFPKHDLVIRNLGFSGDELELNHRLRSAGFGSPDEWMTKNKTDVVFAFFGYNESFGGQANLDKFRKDLGGILKQMLAQKYNGKLGPRVVLFSPIAHENLHDRNLPDGSENNKRLELYTAAMADVARANGVVFVDLFHPTRDLYPKAGPLTINGIHLTEMGNRQLAHLIDRELFGDQPPKAPDAPPLGKLREAVLDKNFHWFHRYRTTDGYSVFGGRADLKFVEGQTNRVVAQREMEILDVMTANRDRRIWAIARGSDLRVDDSNTPEFIPVTTNKPGKGPNGTHLFLDGEEAIKTMKAGKDLKVSLFASEKDFPELAKPVQMGFDTKGRLWVACWPSYPHWKPKEEMNDKLIILEDTKGTGRADKCTVFADKLNNPTGFEFFNGGVLVAQAPDILFLKDTKGTGKADLRVRVVSGIDSADTHHTANSFVLDPGGALYFQEGTFHHTQVETPYGPPVRCANAGVFRYEPRAQKFETYVTFGFANPHGHVFDRWGQDIVVDGTGSDPFHAALFSGRLDYPHKHNRPPQVYKQRSRPCPGMEILSSRQFPEEFQGNLLVGDVINFQGILRYKIEDKGASFAGTELEPIVQSRDPNFRPSDVKVGPDGAIWFTEWQNPIIGHMQHNLRDPSRDRVHGRVYRITYEGRPLSTPARIAGEPIEKVLDLLKDPEDRVRYRARIELGGRKSEEVVAAVQKWIAGLDEKDPNYEHHVLEGLWAHQYQNVVNADLLRRVLASPDFRARAAATRVLCYWRDRVARPLDLLRTQINDSHPRVRLEAVRALSFFDDEQALTVLVDALAHPTDEYINFTFKETLRELELHLGVSSGGNVSGMILRLLNSGKVEKARQGALVETLCRHGGPEELKAVWDKVLAKEAFAPTLRRQALEWLAETAQLRKVKPAGDLSALVGLLTDSETGRDAALRQALVRLAMVWKPDGALKPIQQLAANNKEDAEVQQAAIEALAVFGDEDSRKTIRALTASGQPVRTRFMAVAALAGLDVDTAATAGAAALADAGAQDDPGLMIDAFLNRKGGTDKLAAVLTKVKLGVDPAKRVLRHMYLAGRSDPALANLLSEVAGVATNPKPPTADEVKKLMAEVTAKGDPARGERVFRRGDVGCMKCHSVSKAGGNVGPELSALGGSSPLDYVITSILDPNAAVKEAYLTKVITTNKGLTYTGIVVERDKVRVVLKDATGKLIRIAVADIDEETPGKSLMPEGLTRFLTHDELLDLARFVSELGKPGAYAVRNNPGIQRWRVLMKPEEALTREVPDDVTFRQLVLEAKPEAWQSAYGTVAGVLPVDELKKTPRHEVLYLQGELEVSQAGLIEIDVQSDEATHLWIDGQAFAGKKKVETTLPRGRHTITLRVEAGNAKVGGVKVDVRKPNGSQAQFEVVGGT
jgi:putative heme-binding domain-containing protein